MFEISITDSFASAHYLRGYKGKCERMHGHNYKVEVTIAAGQLNKIGLVYDFTKLKEKLGEIIEVLDHRVLDSIGYFKKNNPSAENIAKYIYDNLKKGISKEQIRLKSVRVWETERASAVYYE
jgi:6-pyruvoyltetrahydropterin/6-carboxytetrahydropterin synthase